MKGCFSILLIFAFLFVVGMLIGSWVFGDIGEIGFYICGFVSVIGFSIYAICKKDNK